MITIGRGMDSTPIFKSKRVRYVSVFQFLTVYIGYGFFETWYRSIADVELP